MTTWENASMEAVS